MCIIIRAFYWSKTAIWIIINLTSYAIIFTHTYISLTERPALGPGKTHVEEIQAFLFLCCFLCLPVSGSIGTLCLRRPGCALPVPFSRESLSKGLIDWLMAGASLEDSPEKSLSRKNKKNDIWPPDMSTGDKSQPSQRHPGNPIL